MSKICCVGKNDFNVSCFLSTPSLTTSLENSPTQRGAKESEVCGIATQATGSLTGTTHVLVVILHFHCSNCRADLIPSSITVLLHSQKVLKLVTTILQPVLQ